MLEELRPLAQEALGPEFVDTRECLAAFYGRRVRERLHLVLSFSPMGDRLRHRSRRFPGLISGCPQGVDGGTPSGGLVHADSPASGSWPPSA